MTSEEQAIYDRNARLARAMGYERIEKYHRGMRIIQMIFKVNDFLLWEFGDNSNGHFAKDRLLRWLAESRERWVSFLIQLELVLMVVFEPPLPRDQQIQKAMLATPDQVASAADAALKDLGFYQESGNR